MVRSNLMKTFLVGLVVLIAFAFVKNFYIKKIEVPLRLGMVNWPGNAVLLLAKHNGHFKDLNLEIVIYPSDLEVIRAVENHAIDIASLTGDEVLNLEEHLHGNKIFLILDYSYGADVLLAQKEIKKITDLKGKKVGVEPVTISFFTLARAMEVGGLPLSEIQIVPTKHVEHADSFNRRDIDAVVTYEPMSSRIIAQGANNLFSSVQIPGEIFDVLIANKNFLKKKSREIEILKKGRDEALADIKSSPEASMAILANYMSVTPEQAKAGFEGIRLPTSKESDEMLNPRNSKILDSLRKISEIMLKYGLLRRPVDPAPLINDSL